jgi:hypothetical protein
MFHTIPTKDTHTHAFIHDQLLCTAGISSLMKAVTIKVMTLGNYTTRPANAATAGTFM